MSKKDWAFWNTQPVPKLDEVIFCNLENFMLKIFSGYYRPKHGSNRAKSRQCSPRAIHTTQRL